jgi:hypothetical protein
LNILAAQTPMAAKNSAIDPMNRRVGKAGGTVSFALTINSSAQTRNARKMQANQMPCSLRNLTDSLARAGASQKARLGTFTIDGGSSRGMSAVTSAMKSGAPSVNDNMKWRQSSPVVKPLGFPAASKWMATISGRWAPSELTRNAAAASSTPNKAIGCIRIRYHRGHGCIIGASQRIEARILTAKCHCGAVRIEVPRRPRTLTSCNCSICRRYGTLWAYYKARDVRVVAARGTTQKYVWGDKTIAFVRCASCGCITHWQALKRVARGRVGVNARNFEPDAIAPARIRRIDT